MRTQFDQSEENKGENVYMAANTEIVTVPKRLVVDLGEKVTPEQAQKAVSACCSALMGQAKKISRLRVVLGRLLGEVQQRKLYKPDFSSFEAYIKSLDETYGLSRSLAREAMQIVGSFPDLSPDDAEDIPYSNLLLAAKAAKKVETPREVRGLLKHAPTLSIVEYRESLVEKNLVPARGRPEGYKKLNGVYGKKTGPATVTCTLPARMARQFKEQAKTRFAGDLGKYLVHLMSLDHGEAEATEASAMEARVARRASAAA